MLEMVRARLDARLLGIIASPQYQPWVQNSKDSVLIPEFTFFILIVGNKKSKGKDWFYKISMHIAIIKRLF